MSSRKTSPVVVVLFLLAGLGVGGYGGWRWLKTSGSASWPSAEGKISASAVDSYRTSSGSKGSSTRKTKYRVEFEYEYKVGETVYHGSDAGTSRSTQAAAAQEQASRYPTGKPLQVWYDPANPVECLLQPGVPSSVWMMLAGGAFLLLLAGYGAFSMLREGQLR